MYACNEGGWPPFELLVRAIAYQQLNDEAAESILERIIALFPGRRFPGPADILATHWRMMRRAGFSRAKIAALKDLAAKALVGTVPTSRVIKRLDDETIVERLMVLPTPKAMLRYGERWKPYRTVASWYLWQAAVGGKQKQAPRING